MLTNREFSKAVGVDIYVQDSTFILYVSNYVGKITFTIDIIYSIQSPGLMPEALPEKAENVSEAQRGPSEWRPRRGLENYRFSWVC